MCLRNWYLWRHYPLVVKLPVRCRLRFYYKHSILDLEDDLNDIETMWRFTGLRLWRKIPDETAILSFRHLLGQHHLSGVLHLRINSHSQATGLS